MTAPAATDALAAAAAAGLPTRGGGLPRVAFYAPMKPASHPTPSGDRRIARLVIEALVVAGTRPVVASELRTLDLAGDPAVQARLATAAAEEARRVARRLAADPPVAWVTYHCHYKAPDLVGPQVSAALGLPYLIVEPSISPRRRAGPWAAFAVASEAAIAAADRLLWTTARDLPALEAAGHGPRLQRLAPFLDAGPAVAPRAARAPLALLTIAMMRPGDKLESYRRLAAGLARLGAGWELTVAGDGPERARVAGMLEGGGPVRLRGAIDDPALLRRICERSDLMVWPGVNEGVGMAWLEAQAASLPVVAEDGPAARAVVSGGLLSPPDDPAALAAAIRAAAADRLHLSATARAHVIAKHGLQAAARTLGEALAVTVS